MGESEEDAPRRMEVPARRRPAKKAAPQSREQILRAVEAMLQSRRLEEMKVSEIVEAAGVSRATFYVHFDTKFSVVAALIEDHVDRQLEIWAPLFEGAGPIEEQLIRDSIVATLQRWEGHAAVLSAAIEGWHTDPEIHELWSAMLARFYEALETRIRRGDPVGAHVDVEALAVGLIALLERCVYLAISTPDSVFARSDMAVVDTVTTIWSRSLGAV